MRCGRRPPRNVRRTDYPAGLKGDVIPLDARIFAIVDVFDALTSQRPYKESSQKTENKAR